MIYIWRCTDCKTVFNREMTVEEYINTQMRCPNKHCNSRKLKRIYMDTPIIFKGNDFTKSNTLEGEM